MIKHSARLNQVTRVFEPYNNRNGYIRLDRNEDPVGLKDELFKNWKDQLTVHDIAAYADSNILVEKLSKWTGAGVDNIYVTSGSDALIKTTFETYIDKGDVILLQNPSWRMYDVYASIYRAETSYINYKEDLSFDIDSLCQHLENNKVRMLVLANPNQPTGTKIEFNDLKKIIFLAKKKDTVVVLDEAYYLFNDDSAINLINEFDNLIIARTFSKAFGMAGLRIGYAVCDNKRVKELMLLRPVTDSNSIAVNLAIFMIDNINYVIEKVNDFNNGRNFLYKKIFDNNILCHKSYANFLLVACKNYDMAKEMVYQTKKNGYLIKGPFSKYPLQNYIRISTGPLNLMQSFWKDCSKIINLCGKIK